MRIGLYNRWLSAVLQPAASGHPVGDDLRQDLQRVLAKLSAAADQAVRLVQCPVCQEWFAQARLGRSANASVSANGRCWHRLVAIDHLARRLTLTALLS